MKVRQYILSCLIMLLAGGLMSSCSETLNLGNDEPANGEVRLRVGVVLPEMTVKNTQKAMGDVVDDDPADDDRKNLDLWLFVFDEAGLFVEAAQATPAPASVGGTGPKTNQNGDETLFNVTLKVSKTKRIIHFVAYYDAAVKPAIESLRAGFDSEISMMTQLKCSGTQDMYWKRLTVDEISENHTEGVFQRVPLVRNYAKITVQKNASLPDATFQLEGFCICNAPSEGYAVAYNNSNGTFQAFEKTVGGSEAGKEYDELLGEGYRGFAPSISYTALPTTTEGFSFYPGAQYLYETPNADGSDRGRTFLIIKGKYNGGASSYYKVDIVRKGEYGTEYYNVLRNINYTMSIDNVITNGHSTPMDAAEHVASNNMSTSVTTETVTNIGDGTQRLFVSNTYFCFTERGTNIEVKFKYMGPHISGGTATASYTFGSNATQNASSNYWSSKFISVHATGDTEAMFSAKPTITPGSAADDWYTVNLSLKEPITEPQVVDLRLYVDQAAATNDEYLSAADKALYSGEIMSRDIQLVLRKPYDWAIKCPASVTSGNLAVNLLLPRNINERLFPLTFYVEPDLKTIYPDTDPATTLGLSGEALTAALGTNPSIGNNVLAVRVGETIVEGKSGQSFQYEKVLTWEDYQKYTATMRHDGVTYKVVPLYFKTNTDASDTWIYAQSTYFEDGAKDQFTTKAAVFDEAYNATMTTTNRYGKGNEIPITFKLLSVPAEGLRVTVTEGDEDDPEHVTNIYDIAASDLHVGENTYIYRTQTFNKRYFEAEISTKVVGALTQQTIEANSDNKRRHILFLPAGTFAPQLWTWDATAHEGAGAYTQATWINEEPSIYFHDADEPDVDGVYPVGKWIDCGWFYLDAGGIRSDYEVDTDRPIDVNGATGFELDENYLIKMEGYNNKNCKMYSGDYIRVRDLIDAYVVGGASQTNGTGSIVAKFYDKSGEPATP